jgi:SAM-dependent methyltransferase
MSKEISLLRKLEYEKIAELKIDGKIIDLGGDKRSGYHELIKGDHKIEAVNLNPDCGADLCFDLEKKFPPDNDSYDAVLCVNVLEHIFNYQNVLSESFRVLKSGGVLAGVVPFLFNVHGSPRDYFRYTGAALEKMFSEAGFRDIKVEELGTGVFSVLFQIKYGFYRVKFIRNLAMKFHIMLDKILIQKILKFLKPDNHLSEKHLPLGYFFVAKK